MRIFGLWLLYALVGGVLIALLVFGGGGDFGSGPDKSPTRTSTKIVAGLCGGAIGALIFCVVMTAPRAAAACVPVVIALFGASIAMIHKDLRQGPNSVRT